MKENKPIKQFTNGLSFTAFVIFLGIVFGGLLRTQQLAFYAEVIHQGIGITVGALLLVLLYTAVRTYRKEYPLIWKLLGFALGIFVVQALLGQLLLRTMTGFWVTGVHFGLSLLVFGLTTASAVYMYGFSYLSTYTPGLKFESKFSKHAVLVVMLIGIVLVSGVMVANTGTGGVCAGWPLCEDGFTLGSLMAWVPILHRIMVGLIGVYVLWFLTQGWQKQRTQRAILTLVTLFGVFFFSQAFVGALRVTGTFPFHMMVLHEATAAALAGVSVIMLVVIGLTKRTDAEEAQDAALPKERKQRFKDFFALNKPIVVSLLLSTTLAGMVIGGGKFPSLGLMLWTMIGGALAAGGSSAVNQYIDRDLDQVMTRTSKRPIPAGRLTPAEGLAYGMGALLVSFYVMAGFVNMTAALLSLTGIVYYVVLYSLFLKKTTVQNIVIGGGAGAMPPLVGYAAASGRLDLTAGFLFLIVFLWTPPHFWSLALTRKNEYAKAGVPMMPVARGEDVTRKLIYQYTIILVLASLLMFALGLVGWVYFIGALVLGGYMIYLSVKVWKVGRNKVYYKMYKHSNYYLLLLFVILAVDAVI